TVWPNAMFQSTVETAQPLTWRFSVLLLRVAHNRGYPTFATHPRRVAFAALAADEAEHADLEAHHLADFDRVFGIAVWRHRRPSSVIAARHRSTLRPRRPANLAGAGLLAVLFVSTIFAD